MRCSVGGCDGEDGVEGGVWKGVVCCLFVVRVSLKMYSEKSLKQELNDVKSQLNDAKPLVNDEKPHSNNANHSKPHSNNANHSKPHSNNANHSKPHSNNAKQNKHTNNETHREAKSAESGEQRFRNAYPSPHASTPTQTRASKNGSMCECQRTEASGPAA